MLRNQQPSGNAQKDIANLFSLYNSLFNSVNQPMVSGTPMYSQGKNGDIRIAEREDGYPYLLLWGKDKIYTTFQGAFQESGKHIPGPYFPNLYVGNLFAKTYTIAQTQATNGAFVVTDSAIVESVGDDELKFKDPTGLNLCPFQVNDKCEIRQVAPDKLTDIRLVQFTVDAVDGRAVTITYTGAGRAKPGDIVIRMGNSSDADRQKTIWFITNGATAPRMALYSGTTGFTLPALPDVGIGVLDGWTSPVFGALTGSGASFKNDIYADSVHLSGAITITTGGVGGWTINATSIYTGTEDHSGYTANAGDMTLYSNGSDASIHAKNFYIDTTGTLYCQSAVIAGSVTLTNTTTFANGGALSLDDVANGTTYSRVLTTDITAGHVKLSECSGNLDDIDNGTTYSKVLTTDITAGHVKLSECSGTLDDIDNGSTYGRIALTDISAGHITLVASTASLNINNTTFGQDGIQLQYNAGNPRGYIGNGSNRYFSFDGTNISWEGANTSLTTAGAFTASSATITGALTTGAGSSISGTYVDAIVANKITAGTGIINSLSVLSTLTIGSAATDGYIQSYGWNGTANGFQIKGGATPTINLIGGTITAGVFKTATTNARVEISSSGSYANMVAFYDASNNYSGQIKGNSGKLYLGGPEVDISPTSHINLTTPGILYINANYGLQMGSSQQFIVNNSGQITKVNNLAASSYTNRFLVSDGTSYTPTAMTSSHVTTALGFTPVTNARTLTINGTGYDLSANRSWTVSSDVTADYAWTGTHTWTKAVSGSYYLTVTNSETSNTSALSGFYMKSNQGGSASGAAFQVFSSQYSDIALAGRARLRTDNALTGIILDTGNASGTHSLKIGGTEYLGIATTGITVNGTVKTALNTTWDLGAANVVSPTSPNRTITVKVVGTTYYIAAKTTND